MELEDIVPIPCMVVALQTAKTVTHIPTRIANGSNQTPFGLVVATVISEADPLSPGSNELSQNYVKLPGSKIFRKKYTKCAGKRTQLIFYKVSAHYCIRFLR